MSRERDEQIARVVFRRILGRHWPRTPSAIGHKIFEEAVHQVVDAAASERADRDLFIIQEATSLILGPPGRRFAYRGDTLKSALARCEPTSIITEVNKRFPPEEPSFAVNNVMVMEPITELPSGWTRVLNSHYPAAGALGGGALGAELHHTLSAAIVGVLVGWFIGVCAAWKSL